VSGIVHTEGHESARDGLTLYWQRWLPEAPRALLLVVHGLFDHGGRYLSLARHFTRLGYGCYAPDLRGHGRSAGPRVHVDRFDEFVGDLETIHRTTRGLHPELPLFLVGHSHGGLVALLHTLRRPEGYRGIVLSSPLLGFNASSGPSAARLLQARLLDLAWPSLRLAVVVPAGFLSHDRQIVEAYLGDPLVGRKASPRWLLSTMAALEEAHRRASELRLPALVMAAGDDRLVDAGATARWADAAPRGRVDYVRWDGLYHEIFNEFEKEAVFDRMERWLEARLAESSCR
jgi:alpha-beta hydrolase superfamily lysophospholipase